ncbi:MAG: putative membrane-associated phospholipid phosphatase [Ignavibacteriae bacterium]|nr:MAG: putative membrane-associated phospholipid phosphatase [Ignavibacteriota bacterium]
MLDLLINIDKALFLFFNLSIANPIFDYVMPLITDWDKLFLSRILLVSLFIYLLFFQGTKGRKLLLLVAITILISDQVSSSVIKPIVARARPCHIIDGKYIVENLRLLVSCGSGFSFPSSHAVNHFAVAVILTYYYNNFKLLFFSIATLVAFSRVYNGVHFPSDIFFGALIGCLIAFVMYKIFILADKKIFNKKPDAI